MKPSIIYSPHYDIRALGLEALHPFDTRKYSRAFGALQARFGHALKPLVFDPGRR